MSRSATSTGGCWPTSGAGTDDLFVNRAMVADGYAHLLTIPPNVAYTDEFTRAMSTAAARQGWGCGERARMSDCRRRQPIRFTPARSIMARKPESWVTRRWSSTRDGQSGPMRPQLGGVERRVHVDLGDTRTQVVDHPLDRAATPTPRGRTRSGRGTRRPPRRRRRGTRSRPGAASTHPPCASAARTRAPDRGRRRRTRAAAASCPCASRGGSRRIPTGRPARSGRVHSRRTSSRSAWSQTSLTVRGNPPSPSSSDGAWVIGPHR